MNTQNVIPGDPALCMARSFFGAPRPRPRVDTMGIAEQLAPLALNVDLRVQRQPDPTHWNRLGRSMTDAFEPVNTTLDGNVLSFAERQHKHREHYQHLIKTAGTDAAEAWAAANPINPPSQKAPEGWGQLVSIDVRKEAHRIDEALEIANGLMFSISPDHPIAKDVARRIIDLHVARVLNALGEAVEQDSELFPEVALEARRRRNEQAVRDVQSFRGFEGDSTRPIRRTHLVAAGRRALDGVEVRFGDLHRFIQERFPEMTGPLPTVADGKAPEPLRMADLNRAAFCPVV